MSKQVGSNVVVLRERDDERKMRKVLDCAALLLGTLVAFAEKRGREDIAMEAAQLCAGARSLALRVSK